MSGCWPGTGDLFGEWKGTGRSMGGAAQDAAEAIARLLRENKQTVAVAESLTSGKLASRLGAAPEASNWFAGGVVAYAAHVKFEVLGVEPGPVVSEQCARQMARGVVRLMRCGLRARGDRGGRT